MAVSQSTQKWILSFFMFLNGIITPGGIIYGWPGLSQLLKNEGQYSDGCVDYDPDKTCGSQDNKLNNIFAVGANIATLSTIVYGFTLDRWGVRLNAFSGAMLMALGFVLLGTSQAAGSGQDGFDGFMIGFALVAFGGLGTYLPAFQFSALFERPTRVLAAQSALFGAAGCTFTFLLFLAEEHGVSRRTSYLAYAGLVGFCGLNMLLLYPARSYKRGDPVHLPVLGWLGLADAPVTALDADEEAGKANVNGSNADYAALTDESDPSASKDPYASPILSDGTLLSSAAEVEQLKSARLLRDLSPAEHDLVKNSRTLKEELFNPGTLLVALHFSIGLLCCNMYNANIATLLKNMGDASGKMANAFVFIVSLYPMLFSLSIDELQKRFRYAGTSFISTTCLIIGFSFLFIDNQYAQIPAFFIFSTGRALLITVMFSFVAIEYRGDHYGRVIAFVTTICAAIGLLQLALQKLLNGPAEDNFDYFTTGMICALTPLYYFSYWCHKMRV